MLWRGHRRGGFVGTGSVERGGREGRVGIGRCAGEVVLAAGAAWREPRSGTERRSPCAGFRVSFFSLVTRQKA